MTSTHQRARFLLLAIGALGFSCVVTQLALMRELLGAFSGNEMVLGIVLGLWLLLMGTGTRLGRACDTLRSPLTVFVSLQTLAAVLPLLQVFLLRALRNVVFVRGATVGVVETVAGALVLLLPYCLVAGYTLTLACSLLARCTHTMDTMRVPPSAATSQLKGTTSLTPALSPRRGGIVSSAGPKFLIGDLSERVKRVFPLLGERVRVRVSQFVWWVNTLQAATPNPSLAAGRVYVADASAASSAACCSASCWSGSSTTLASCCIPPC